MVVNVAGSILETFTVGDEVMKAIDAGSNRDNLTMLRKGIILREMILVFMFDLIGRREDTSYDSISSLARTFPIVFPIISIFAKKIHRIIDN